MTADRLEDLARRWWARFMKSRLVSVTIKHDGYIRFEWESGSDGGPYHLPIERMKREMGQYDR